MSRALVGVVFAVGLLFGPSDVEVRAQDLRSDEGPEQEPLTTGAAATRTTSGLLTEPPLLTSAIDTGFVRFGDTGTPSNGFYVELSNMITGSGWVSIGPGYRHEILNGNGFVDGSAAVSWHAYNMAQSRVVFPDLLQKHFTLGAQVMWQDETQVDYFGMGAASLSTNGTEYRIQTLDTVSWAIMRPLPSLSLTGELGFLRRPDIMTPGGTFRSNAPSTMSLFPTDPGVSDAFQPNFAHSEVALMSDTRDHRSRPTSGGLYRAAVTTYVDQSTSTNLFSFRQYEAEGLQFIPVMRNRAWIFALHAWTVWDDVRPGHHVPFYMQPTIGGNNTLRSYPDYRFHDLNMVVANVESRWALFTHVDVALFMDAGNVAPVYQDLNLAKKSYGGGVRLHTATTTFARADVAWGSEGWAFVFRTSDVFRLARITRRVAAVPFVP